MQHEPAACSTEVGMEDTSQVPDIEMHSFEDGSAMQDGDDKWEDVADEELISYVIHNVLDAQLVSSIWCGVHHTDSQCFI